MNDRRYAGDKPADCAYCYFWDRKKTACKQAECYYLVKEGQPAAGRRAKRGVPGVSVWQALSLYWLLPAKDHPGDETAGLNMDKKEGGKRAG